MSILASWRALLAGAAVGLGVATVALVVLIVFAEWRHVAYNDGAAASFAYLALIYGMAIGAAAGLTARRRRAT